MELQTTTRHVDLVAENVDVALRGGVTREPSLIARPLLRTEMIAVVSPAYVAREGSVDGVEDLERHRCLRWLDSGLRPARSWPLRDGGSVSVQGPIMSNDIMALLGAVLSGTGVAILPRALVDEHLARGELTTVLEGVVGQRVSLSLVWVEREFIDPKVRAFVEFAVDWMQSTPFSP